MEKILSFVQRLKSEKRVFLIVVFLLILGVILAYSDFFTRDLNKNELRLINGRGSCFQLLQEGEYTIHNGNKNLTLKELTISIEDKSSGKVAYYKVATDINPLSSEKISFAAVCPSSGDHSWYIQSARGY
ncbi:MAG: hypothetical protein GKS04_03180 [Candidatus Mycalebacterium zealandia]|nr:MAG: hypothetical protein GKS04_03180 [Candidatus Mycalebacterium zealandia]